MEMENKNTVLTDEELKEVTGGISVSNEYCAAKLTEKVCRQYWTWCQWYSTNTNEYGGVCVVKGRG